MPFLLFCVSLRCTFTRVSRHMRVVLLTRELANFHFWVNYRNKLLAELNNSIFILSKLARVMKLLSEKYFLCIRLTEDYFYTHC